MARQELAHYLRDRRAALRPHEIGLAATGTDRRTPGLRREEVAELAHMSVDYYTRLEQAPGAAAIGPDPGRAGPRAAAHAGRAQPSVPPGGFKRAAWHQRRAAGAPARGLDAGAAAGDRCHRH